MLVVALALPPGWTARLGGLPEMSWLEVWATAGLLWIWFYASFSAWSDLAIGAARLCGRRVPENFDRPWRATDPADFWRRWHVSFGHWLRDYVYIPLGGSRRRRVRNVLVTFLVSALWHVWGTLKLLGLGYYPPVAWTGFLLWGVLHAGGVLVAPRLARSVDGPGPWKVRVASVATFAFAAFCWVPFFTPAGVTPQALLRTLGFMLCPLAP
jgi:D-alanyl-lipoteichoic acid acyltransferase DltB (MBOAT superfamily)